MQYRSPAAVLDSPAARGTAVAGVDIPVEEGVLGRHLAVDHTVNFLQDNRRRVKKKTKKNLRSLLNLLFPLRCIANNTRTK